ncbi:hypothetical protein Moror_6178 [Moniliophthora roreri MCA 2997]|uniref:Uncharacterized protein n=1 Tax=Moniliophthora roreri (strain MCA 2997) TaxID=1381753 RepID=V2WCC0_MONRO|nr:hypothetical protein Moror_6178 [Moniliophthora roreri MCA 2997]
MNPKTQLRVKPGEPVILCKKSNHALVDVVCEWPALPAHALKSDYEPSSAEVLHAKAALQAEEVALGRYDAEIKRLRQAAEELQEKSVALKERMSQRRAMVSLMRKVATEIWDIPTTQKTMTPEPLVQE